MKAIMKNRKQQGLTLIETLVALGIGLIVSLSIIFFLNNIREKMEDREIASIFVQIAGAMDTRFSIDGYSKTNFNDLEWTGNDETNKFLNGFNGKNGTCPSADGWVPNTTDAALKDKYIKSKPIPCNIFKVKSPLDTTMDGKLTINAINSQILTSYVSFYYKEDDQMLKNFSRWKNIINEAYSKDSLNNSSKHIYTFMDRTKNEFINNEQCVSIKKECALVVGVVSDEASSLIHLSTIGDNKQVGKLSFSKGILNPQVCQKWSYDNATSSWTMSKTICGIENDNEKIGFKLGNVNSDLVMMDKMCNLREKSVDKYINVVDNSGVIVPVISSTVPCGISTIKDGPSFVVTAVVDDIKTKDFFTNTLSSHKLNTDVLTVNNLTVTEKTNVYGTTTIDNTLTVSGHFFGTDLNTATMDGQELRTKNGFNIGENLIGLNSLDEMVTNIQTKLLAYSLETQNLNTTDIQTDWFKSYGAFNIGGNIITHNFKETGVLSADSISFMTPTGVKSSGSLGGYASIGGYNNTEGVGVEAGSAYFYRNFMTRLNTDYTDKYMIQIKDGSGNVAFGVTSHGGMYLKNALVIPNQYGGSSYSVDNQGNVSANVNFYESSGCCTDAPTQFYGPVFIGGTFTINSNPRFVDVEDTSWRSTGYIPDKNFIIPNAKYSIGQYAEDSLVFNNLRLSSYANFIGKFESDYNSFYNAINTPGLKGKTGTTGDAGVQGDQGAQGEQGPTGSIGATGPSYNANGLIWLPKEVTCGTSDADMNTKYGSSNVAGAWTYNDVIEGSCSSTGKNKIKYFKRTTPISGTCPSSTEYDVYECKEAKFRIEPYAYNYKVEGNFCLGDRANRDPAEGIEDPDNNTICYTDLNRNHFSDGRATRVGSLYFAKGTGSSLGSANSVSSVRATIGNSTWTRVANCGANTRTPEDILGLDSVDTIEDDPNFIKLADSDLNMACSNASTSKAMAYRKVNYTGLKYGNPSDFDNYRQNNYNNVNNYLKNNASACSRDQVYEISKCQKGVPDLTKLDYTTHPKGFPMPKRDDVDNGNGGLTGKYIWLKSDKVCLAGSVADSYPGVSDWESGDRINTACSVENTYRSEFLGACGANNDRSSYQMYRCRDEFYKPAVPELSYRLADIKCLNVNGQAIDPATGMPAPIQKITDFYADAKLSSTTLTTGKECTVERETLYNEEVNSNQCSTGYNRYTVYQCR